MDWPSGSGSGAGAAGAGAARGLEGWCGIARHPGRTRCPAAAGNRPLPVPGAAPLPERGATDGVHQLAAARRADVDCSGQRSGNPCSMGHHGQAHPMARHRARGRGSGDRGVWGAKRLAGGCRHAFRPPGGGDARGQVRRRQRHAPQLLGPQRRLDRRLWRRALSGACLRLLRGLRHRRGCHPPGRPICRGDTPGAPRAGPPTTDGNRAGADPLGGVGAIRASGGPSGLGPDLERPESRAPAKPAHSRYELQHPPGVRHLRRLGPGGVGPWP